MVFLVLSRISSFELTGLAANNLSPDLAASIFSVSSCLLEQWNIWLFFYFSVVILAFIPKKYTTLFFTIYGHFSEHGSINNHKCFWLVTWWGNRIICQYAKIFKWKSNQTTGNSSLSQVVAFNICSDLLDSKRYCDFAEGWDTLLSTWVYLVNLSTDIMFWII